MWGCSTTIQLVEVTVCTSITMFSWPIRYFSLLNKNKKKLKTYFSSKTLLMYLDWWYHAAAFSIIYTDGCRINKVPQRCNPLQERGNPLLAFSVWLWVCLTLSEPLQLPASFLEQTNLWVRHRLTWDIWDRKMYRCCLSKINAAYLFVVCFCINRRVIFIFGALVHMLKCLMSLISHVFHCS